MTHRELIARYLTAQGRTMLRQTGRHMIFIASPMADGTPRFLFLGRNGSCRIGRSVSNSVPVGNGFKARALSYVPTVADASLLD